MVPVAQDLVERGFAVWNLEYRRLGEPGGGWPGTLEDVSAGVDHLAALVAEGVDLDLDRVTVAGHSAGGHLALLVAAYAKRRGGEARVWPCAAVGLAPVADLAGASALRSGRGAVDEFLGGSLREQPERYAAASPLALVPLGVKHMILHGTADEALPIELTWAYAQAALAAGDAIEMIELPGAGHMDYLDPASAAHAMLCQWLISCSPRVGAHARI
jgi:acetyl esterase/lipase